MVSARTSNRGVPPKCKMCDGLVTWTYKTKSWKTYCSRECVYLDNQFISLKRKQTLVDNYGVDHNWSSGPLRDKQKQTMVERYGVEHPAQHPSIHEKIKATNLEKYGVEFPLQNKDILNKWEQTNQSKYGVKVASILHSTKNKQHQTMIMRYGSYIKQTHIVDILPLIDDYNWLYNQYITEGKTAKQISVEIGINDTTIGRYLQKYEIEIRKAHQSFVSRLWLNEQNIIIEYEFPIPGTKFKADGYCQETNTIYEFYGDFWHGNPKIYSSDTKHPIIYKTMGELYNKTIEREQQIREMGYNLVVMWESDYNAI